MESCNSHCIFVKPLGIYQKDKSVIYKVNSIANCDITFVDQLMVYFK